MRAQKIARTDLCVEHCEGAARRNDEFLNKNGRLNTLSGAPTWAQKIVVLAGFRASARDERLDFDRIGVRQMECSDGSQSNNRKHEKNTKKSATTQH